MNIAVRAISISGSRNSDSDGGAASQSQLNCLLYPGGILDSNQAGVTDRLEKCASERFNANASREKLEIARQVQGGRC